MLFKKIIQLRFPFITLLLVISCLVTSIPQLFLPHLYNEITGQFPNIGSLYLITLPVFSHSPEMFINHLIGNLLIIILFGGLIEILLGSSKFSLVTLSTFTSTTFLNYFHLNGSGSAHGVSGVCFGYIVFFLFFIIIILENKNYSLFKNPIIPFSIFLAVFSIIGIPILEIVVLNQRLFQNFGQTGHLLSYFSVIPLLILWRKEFEQNAIALISNQLLPKSESTGNISKVMIICILIINLFSTIYVSVKVQNIQNDKFTYTVLPEVNTKISELERIILIHSNHNLLIDSENLTKKSINYESQDVPDIHFGWIDSNNMKIELSRSLKSNESIHLIYIVKRELFNGIYITENIELKYGEI